jgi:hypothetical protein
MKDQDRPIPPDLPIDMSQPDDMATPWGDLALGAAGTAAWTAWTAALAAAREVARDAAYEKQATDLRIVLEHYDAAPGCEIHGWKGMR